MSVVSVVHVVRFRQELMRLASSQYFTETDDFSSGIAQEFCVDV